MFDNPQNKQNLETKSKRNRSCFTGASPVNTSQSHATVSALAQSRLTYMFTSAVSHHNHVVNERFDIRLELMTLFGLSVVLFVLLSPCSVSSFGDFYERGECVDCFVCISYIFPS